MLYKNIKLFSAFIIITLLILSFALFGANNLFMENKKAENINLEVNNRKTDFLIESLKKKNSYIEKKTIRFMI